MQGGVAVVESERADLVLRRALAGELQTVFQPIVEPDARALGARDVLGVAGAGTGSSRCSVVLEITERALFERPASLLRDIAEAREHGCLVAVDDVGATERSLALMPLLQPDLLKLDLQLVQRHPDNEIARIVNAVRAEAERAGSTILAEGIETERHLEMAHGLGATLGQGYLFGKPQALTAISTGQGFVSSRTKRLAVPRTPFELLGSRLPTRISRKPLLIEISKQLEAEALALAETATVVAAFQEARFFSHDTRRRYRRLAAQTALVIAIASNLDRQPAPNVRGVALEPDDPLTGEWTITVLSPHFAACLSARDLGDDADEAERRFEYVLTFDRDLTIAAARSMLTRLARIEVDD